MSEWQDGRREEMRSKERGSSDSRGFLYDLTVAHREPCSSMSCSKMLAMVGVESI